jgi:transcriptional regulator with XRE-family HTH domain
MGRSHRPKPARLASKLLSIREALDISQAEMVKRLDYPRIHPAHVSGYERGEREPPLPVLLRYARMVGISTDVLIDDELDLLARLPKRSRR